MFGISDFVRNTLAYVSNCGVAFVTLLVSACRLRPVRGAIRCKVRQDTQAAEVPDSRVMLFIAACLLAFDLTYAFSGTASMLTAIAGAVTGAHRAADSTIVTAVALYFACEWSISGATSRRALPGRRGRRNRQILRFLVAALLIQVAVYGPLAMWLLALGVNVSWATMSGRPPSFLGTLVDDALFIVRLAIAFAPFVFLGVFLSQAKAFRLSANTPRILAALPMTLIVTALAASFVTWILYPPRTPKIVAIRCTARPGGSNDVVVVDATFVNEGDQWWRPRQLLMLDVLGEERTNPVTGETSDYQTGGMTLAFNEDPDPLIVPPHGRINLHREVPLDKGSVKGATGCALTNGTPTSSPDFYSIFFSESDAWASEIDWDAIEPANHLKGRFIQPETDIRVAPLENTGGPENAN